VSKVAPAIVVVDGRLYEVEVSPSNCESLKHGHDAPHADGTPGTPYHHHHASRCGDYPLGATLRPMALFADRDADLREYEAAHPGGTEFEGHPRGSGAIRARAGSVDPFQNDHIDTRPRGE
jgi:hypothetical protein